MLTAQYAERQRVLWSCPYENLKPNPDPEADKLACASNRPHCHACTAQDLRKGSGGEKTLAQKHVLSANMDACVHGVKKLYTNSPPLTLSGIPWRFD